MACGYSTLTHGNHANSCRVRNDASFQELCLAPSATKHNLLKGWENVANGFCKFRSTVQEADCVVTRAIREKFWSKIQWRGSLQDKVWWTFSWHNYNYKRLMTGIIKSSCAQMATYNLCTAQLHAKSLACIKTTPDTSTNFARKSNWFMAQTFNPLA